MRQLPPLTVHFKSPHNSEQFISIPTIRILTDNNVHLDLIYIINLDRSLFVIFVTMYVLSTLVSSLKE